MGTGNLEPGSALPPPTPGQSVEAIRRDVQRKRRWVLGILLGVAVVAVWLGAAVDDDTAAGSRSQGNAYSAHAACAEFTRDRLKSPATADFPEYDDRGVTISHAGDTWTVRSFVDAENSFGANIRTDFVCVVEARGDTWYLESWFDN